LLLAIGCSEKRQAQVAPASVVLALGDSITAGSESRRLVGQNRQVDWRIAIDAL